MDAFTKLIDEITNRAISIQNLKVLSEDLDPENAGFIKYQNFLTRIQDNIMLQSLCERLLLRLKKDVVDQHVNLNSMFRDPYGYASFLEIFEAFSKASLRIDKEELKKLCSCVDSDENGKISYKELISKIYAAGEQTGPVRMEKEPPFDDYSKERYGENKYFGEVYREERNEKAPNFRNPEFVQKDYNKEAFSYREHGSVNYDYKQDDPYKRFDYRQDPNDIRKAPENFQNSDYFKNNPSNNPQGYGKDFLNHETSIRDREDVKRFRKENIIDPSSNQKQDYYKPSEYNREPYGINEDPRAYSKERSFDVQNRNTEFYRDQRGEKNYRDPYINRDTYNKSPYDKDPYDKDPYDKDPYDKNPYDKNPYDKNPYDKNPYDRDPYNSRKTPESLETPDSFRNYPSNNPQGYGKDYLSRETSIRDREDVKMFRKENFDPSSSQKPDFYKPSEYNREPYSTNEDRREYNNQRSFELQSRDSINEKKYKDPYQTNEFSNKPNSDIYESLHSKSKNSKSKPLKGPKQHWARNYISMIQDYAQKKQMSTKQVFLEFDIDKSNSLTSFEFARAFETMGIRIPQGELQNLMEELDSNRDGRISLTEFEKILGKREIDPKIENKLDEFREFIRVKKVDLRKFF